MSNLIDFFLMNFCIINFIYIIMKLNAVIINLIITSWDQAPLQTTKQPKSMLMFKTKNSKQAKVLLLNLIKRKIHPYPKKSLNVKIIIQRTRINPFWKRKILKINRLTTQRTKVSMLRINRNHLKKIKNLHCINQLIIQNANTPQLRNWQDITLIKNYRTLQKYKKILRILNIKRAQEKN